MGIRVRLCSRSQHGSPLLTKGHHYAEPVPSFARSRRCKRRHSAARISKGNRGEDQTCQAARARGWVDPGECHPEATAGAFFSFCEEKVPEITRDTKQLLKLRIDKDDDAARKLDVFDQHARPVAASSTVRASIVVAVVIAPRRADWSSASNARARLMSPMGFGNSRNLCMRRGMKGLRLPRLALAPDASG